jgi:hypothetical protein
MKEQIREVLADRDHAGSQIDRMLSTAESLQEKCEVRERRFIMTIYLTGFGFLTWCSLSLAVTNIPGFKGTESSSVFTYLNLASAFLLGMILYLLCRRDREQQSRDRRTIHSIVDMLREVEAAITSNVELSALELQHMKLRLQRFEIGPSSEIISKQKN